MEKVSEFQEHAHQCRVLAASSSNREHRDMLSKMAETWESLAKNREIRIARHRRIDELETVNTASPKESREESTEQQTADPTEKSAV